GVAAVDAVMNGEAETAFCAVRPPGHHATPNAAMGFCLLNNVAIAAAHALERHGLERVAVVDFDVHHGNGTQDIFRNEPRVAYLSSHESGIYPHTGSPHERGVGNLRNVLLPPGSGGFRFQNVWAEELLPWLDDFRPQLLLVSAGFDAHMHDPLADLMLETEDFAWLTRELRRIARRHAGGRLVSMLEGGYSLEALRECSVAHVAELR
ncbi:MAG TPA: histone deacetylase family protein, partial [Pseudoxanthomonas sp.]|nr:histone deacetylase family protein [Pseudoxanthomonas sp.]